MASFLRVDKEKIFLKCETKYPNELLSFDVSLINPEEIRKLMVPGSTILLNSDKGR